MIGWPQQRSSDDSGQEPGERHAHADITGILAHRDSVGWIHRRSYSSPAANLMLIRRMRAKN